jgi:predicted outer membrane repeat protein
MGNQASTGGGLRLKAQFLGNSVLIDCSFFDNSATSRGGAVEAQLAGFTATGCVFLGNSGPKGGAVYLRGYSTSMTDCFLSGNSGALGGAILCTASATPEFAGCTFVENGGGFGGALASYDSEPSASQCTFVSNTATSAGGGLYIWDSALSLESCIVVFSGQGEAVTCGGDASADLTCCDLFGNAGGDWVGCVADQSGTNGNISEDPLFCGSQNPEEPYTLQEDSPCAPEGNPECGLIGAWPVACGSISGTPDDEPVGRITTWGRIKAGTGN